MAEEEKQLEVLLKEYSVFELIENKKLRCTLTGHEIPSKFNQLNAYIKTPKFVCAWRIHKIMEEYGEYFDDVGPKEFGCKITRKLVAKDPEDLLRHVNGKRFKSALKQARKTNLLGLWYHVDSGADSMLIRSLEFPCIDAPHAPLADAFEVDDFMFDIDTEQYCDMQILNAHAALNEKSKESDNEEEEEMEQDEIDGSFGNDDSYSEDGNEEVDEDEEYPELTKTDGEAVVENDSYDFAVMDTEKDMNNANRKRRADSSTTRKKKRVR